MNRVLSIGFVVLMLLPATGCAAPQSGGSGAGNEQELRSYQGETLDSMSAFFENSIKGPQKVDIDKYRLRVTGLVTTPLELTYDHAVKDYPTLEKVITIHCVEGWQVKALWTGIPLGDILAKAGVKPGAKVVIFRSVDGYSTSIPMDYVQDHKLMLAYKINGVTLPPERGYPFELVAEGKWGYKWIKWVNSIELSDDVNFHGFWESRGYNQNGDLSGPIYQD
jgi:DMSO/TMAO reductase YedYZ molybdopterin-dependent catalytic subunit